MAISDQQLFDLLLETKIISEDALKNALSLAKASKSSLYDEALKADLIKDENVGRLIADFFNVPFIDLTNVTIEEKIIKIIPKLVAKKQAVISFKTNKDGVHLAMNDPRDLQIKEFIEKKSGLTVKVYYATQRGINKALELYGQDIDEAFSDILADTAEQAKGKIKKEPEIVKIVDTIIRYAYQNKASDIHIEPLEEKTLVRFRIDGILHDIIKLPQELHESIVTRIKVLAKLRTDEHQATQDGKLQYTTEDQDKVDIRVSIAPITKGEKIVMRLLSEHSRRLSLVDLGLMDEDLEKVKLAYQQSHGMILSTGPTGSGKTTTLYSILKMINKREVNIATIEDPVEYDIEGVSQIQVNIKTNLTFASGLRSIVRQDPDVILVGEIRDEETADIAINSAMTGHLVLSTLHTNDAATTIPRLMEMNVEPFLISSSVRVIVAQRLVRRICHKCRVSYNLKIEGKLKGNHNIDPKHLEADRALLKQFPRELLAKYFGKEEIYRVYRGKGCDLCHHSGYYGRIGIFEVMLVDDQIREAVVTKKDANTIQNIAVKNDMTTLVEDGLKKASLGLSTLEEILRVAQQNT